MEEDSAPTRSEHHRLGSRLGLGCSQRGDCLPGRLAPDHLRSERVEIGEAQPSAAAVKAGSAFPVLPLGDYLHAQAAEILGVFSKPPSEKPETPRISAAWACK